MDLEPQPLQWSQLVAPILPQQRLKHKQPRKQDARDAELGFVAVLQLHIAQQLVEFVALMHVNIDIPNAFKSCSLVEVLKVLQQSTNSDQNDNLKSDLVHFEIHERLTNIPHLP